MSYKEINLRATTAESACTEIMYEVATLRADGVQLIRLNINIDGNSDDIDGKKLFSAVVKLLRDMKWGRRIQFFATRDSFKLGKTEAVFLQNKYPDIFDGLTSHNEGSEYVYIKL